MPNLTTTQAAAQLNIDSSTIRRWCESGALKATKHGRAWVIDSDVLKTFVRPKKGPPFKKAGEPAER
jgi:excisionase family DNA binding protein